MYTCCVLSYDVERKLHRLCYVDDSSYSIEDIDLTNTQRYWVIAADYEQLLTTCTSLAVKIISIDAHNSFDDNQLLLTMAFVVQKQYNNIARNRCAATPPLHHRVMWIYGDDTTASCTFDDFVLNQHDVNILF